MVNRPLPPGYRVSKNGNVYYARPSKSWENWKREQRRKNKHETLFDVMIGDY